MEIEETYNENNDDNFSSSSLKYPSYIVNTDSIVNNLITDENCEIYFYKNTSDNNVPKILTSIATMFNQIENLYNKNQYYYGELPTVIYNKLRNKIDINQIIADIITNSFDIADYVNQDYNNIYYLIIRVLLILTEESSDNIKNLNETYSILTELYKCSNIYFNRMSFATVDPNTSLVQNICETENVDNELFVYYFFLQTFTKDIIKKEQEKYIKRFLKFLGIEYRDYKQQNVNININDNILNYFKTKYNNNNVIQSINNIYDLQDNLIQSWQNIFNEQINTIYNSLVNKNKTLFKDYTYDIYKSYIDEDDFNIYIYTSFQIYLNDKLIPPIQSNDEGNGRLSEFLLSSVYEKLGNCLLISDDIDNLTSIINMYNKCLRRNYKYIYIGDYILLNLQDYNTYYYNKLCPLQYDTNPLRYNDKSQCNINFDEYNVPTDIYNKINILNTRYILVKRNDNIQYFLDNFNENTDIATIQQNTIEIIRNFNCVFRPLKPLYKYYSKMKTNFKQNFKWIRKMKNIYDDTLDINNDNVGGDLYSIINGNFYLIDSKRYEKGLDCKHTLTTLLQTYMYMNAYAKPLAYINSECLYKTLNIGIVNPIDNVYKVVDYYEFLEQIQSSNYDNYDYRDKISNESINTSTKQFLFNHINHTYHLYRCLNCETNKTNQDYLNAINKITNIKKCIKDTQQKLKKENEEVDEYYNKICPAIEKRMRKFLKEKEKKKQSKITKEKKEITKRK